MKKIITTLAGIAFVGIAPAFADNTDTKTVTVSGSIVAPLQITSAGTLTMPHLVKPVALNANGAASLSGGTTAVTLGCGATDASNSVAYTPGGNPFAHGTAAAPGVSGSSANVAVATGIVAAAATGACSDVAVGGNANYFFTVTTGTVVQPLTGGVTISAPTCVKSTGAAIVTNVQLDGSGLATIRCGATVTAGLTAISYTDGKFDVTVTYD